MERGPRNLEISAELATAIAAFRKQSGTSEDARLNLDRLQDVESALGIVFEDDVLAVFAAGDPYLRDEVGLDLAKVVGHTGALHEQQQLGDLVGIGRSDETTFLCIDARGQKPGRSETFLVDSVGGSRVSVGLASFLDSLLENLAISLDDVGSYSATLYRPQPESSAVGRRVRHKIFGEGRALREDGAGPTAKVSAEFPKVGLKLLQARFLEFLD